MNHLGRRLPSLTILVAAVLGASAEAQWTAPNPVTDFKNQPDGVVFRLKTGTLRLQVCTPTIVHLMYSLSSSFPDHANPVVIKTSWHQAPWSLQLTKDDITLITAALSVAVNRETGAITYADTNGRTLLHDDSKTMTPVTINGEQTYRAEDYMNLVGYGSTEALYGLGQHQAGVWNYRGESIELSQDNTSIAVPLMVSSVGYGLFWNNPSRSRFNNRFEHALYVSSEVADTIDYYFLYGPELDKVIAGYRELTGAAPMFGKWAYGFWQCKNRYQSQAELLGVAQKYRKLKIPIDNIVQDWFYWKEDQWGSHQFDPSRFPDPDGWVRDIHDKYHAHLMISVWPKFYPTTTNFQIMRARHFLYEPNLGEDIIDWTGHPDTFYDAFNSAARELFWSQVNEALFSKGVDAWWMDASEPDMTPTPTLAGQRAHMHPTAMGTGARMLNAYPLVNSEAIYEGQRQAASNQRVFILTRSGFAGEQRYAAAVWSGDTSCTWTAMRAQITAGLGFCLSGMPYWTMDIGGFSVPSRFSARKPKPGDAEEWNELNARWFEFGTFVPFLRVHGEFPYREMWEFGGNHSPAYNAELKFDRIRYLLLPYIYSLAGAVTHDGGTIMRALVMDFPADTNVFNIGDEYLFGPALLVNPVTTFQARNRPVYLPTAPGGWYDFWNGQWLGGGQTIDAAAPYNAIPIYVRAGSIIPTGPEIQYTGEKPADPITLHVYAGADGRFTLYEDDGLTYNYEQGAFARIPIIWDDSGRALTIGERKGTFKGMLKERTFNVVLVTRHSPAGLSVVPASVRSVKYNGKAVRIKID